MGRSAGVGVVVAGLVLAVGGCGGGADERTGASDDTRSAAPTPARPASGELVRWVGGMCASANAVKELRAESAEELRGIRDPDEDELSARARAVGYLAGTPTDVRSVESDLAELGASGVPAADRLRDAWQKKVGRVVARLDGVSPAVGLEQAEGSAADVDRLVQSLTPPKPDLPALTKADPRLAAAYQRAERCAPGGKPATGETSTATSEPTGPLPEAADGRNYRACSDGACEVLVTSEADITANGVSVRVSVADDHVTFRTAGTLMQLGGAGGEAGFGNELKATVVAHDEDGAVLKFANP
ncbi:hypothetical protein [Streptomyces hawaiiensis]|uniref:hypothetical protein n=1 Tax=Streptomyces hawaiiensis TaxID=67305 RepID=UPI0036527479